MSDQSARIAWSPPADNVCLRVDGVGWAAQVTYYTIPRVELSYWRAVRRMFGRFRELRSRVPRGGRGT